MVLSQLGLWAVDCEGTTKSISSICAACQKKPKSPTVIKKEQHIENDVFYFIRKVAPDIETNIISNIACYSTSMSISV